jgi:regulator of cell morphogenesis and NO signaling
MTQITIEKELTLAQIVAAQPSRSRVLEDYGLDYCCGGKRTLDKACQESGIDPTEVISRLADWDARSKAQPDLTDVPLPELIDDIVTTHHAYLRDELPRLTEMFRAVVRAHGARYPELGVAENVFAELSAELESHMQKEERILFPMLRKLASGAGGNFHCGSIANPITVMELEHDSAAAALRELRRLTRDYDAPVDACGTYRALLSRLSDLEADLHVHIHKENNVLFPRALAVESRR